jgi:hypothetical protein
VVDVFLQVVLRVIAEEMSASSGTPPVIKGAVKDLKALFKASEAGGAGQQGVPTVPTFSEHLPAASTAQLSANNH